MMARKNQGRKREQPALEIDGEHEMDDMAIAAQFAALTYSNPITTTATANPPPKPTPTADNNEIDLEDEEEEESDIAAVDEIKGALKEDEPTVDSSQSESEEEVNNNHHRDNDDDDDDDSHIDMAAELAELERMEQTSGDNAAPPKTENELDSYSTPLSEIEKKFHLKLTVEDQDTQKYYSPDKVKLSDAGTVKNHMIQDRTIIVESFHREGFSAPLDEGSLLVFQMTAANDNNHHISLIPMGKIFEVFGPVRKPLYTIRLPSPAEMKAMQASSKNASSEVAQEQEASKKVKEDQEESKKDKVDSGAETQLNDKTTSADPWKKSDKTIAEQASTDTIPSEQAPMKNEPPENDNQIITKVEETETQKPDDHWSRDGKYTRFLRENPELTVFYVQDEAKIIDAEAILRLSAKGCDASNVFDEEVVNVNEMYFSDDEEERQLKGKGRRNHSRTNDEKRGSNRQSNSRPNRGRGGFPPAGGPVPSGFHHQHAQPPRYPPHPMGYPQAQQQWPHHQPMAFGAGAHYQPVAFGAGAPPPPPPGAPPQHQIVYPPAGYPVPQYAPAGFSQGYVPPPPSYPNPNPQYANNLYPQQATLPHNPPQHSSGQQQQQQQQQSDTIYYDYT